MSQGTISCWERGISPIPQHISDTLYQCMCADDTDCDEYRKMQQEYIDAYNTAQEAGKRITEFWEEHIANNWNNSRGDRK